MPVKLPRFDVSRFEVTCGDCHLRMWRGPYSGMPSTAMALKVATGDGCPRCGGLLQVMDACPLAASSRS